MKTSYKKTSYKKTLCRGTILCFFLILLASIPVLWKVVWHTPSNVDFWFHHAKYESIVQKMKAQPLPSSKTSKKQLIENCDVWVMRAEDGKYTITIKTCGWGHFGMAGYVYADSPPISKNDPYSDIDAPGDLWMKGERLNKNWWTVFNNLY